MKTPHYTLLILLITAILTSGCDLNDKGLSFEQLSIPSEKQDSDTSSNVEEKISGAVVTAPIHNASVDTMYEGALTNIGYTQKGRIHFTKINSIKKYPKVLYANQQRKGHFADGTQVNIKPRGIMLSENDSPYITPLTTLAALMFEKGPQTHESAEKIKQKITALVHNTFGLPHFDPFADPTEEGLSKHEVLQQALLVTLGLGQETDAIAMDDFIPTLNDVVDLMEDDTFLGAAQQVNPKITSTIEEYIKAHQVEITNRASVLLAKEQVDPTQQEIARITFLREMDDLISSELRTTADPILFLSTEMNDEKSFSPLQPVIALPQNKTPIPFHFKISLLGSEDSLTNATANKTKEPTPLYKGDVIISSITLPENASSVFNEGAPLSPNRETQLSASSKTFANGSDFTFFMDNTSEIGSSHQITFAAASDPTVTTTITFIAKQQDAVIIKSITGTSSKKLFVFDGGGLTSIAENSLCPLEEAQLSATLETDINQISSDELTNTIEVKFTLPEGLAFSMNDIMTGEYTVKAPTETTSDSFIFTIPSFIDIVAEETSLAEKKNVTIQVINCNTLDVIAETNLECCFVSKEALNRLVGVEIIDAPSLVQTYPANNDDQVVTLPDFTFSCKLLSWYDLAEIPREEQPEYPLGYPPQSIKLRFENMENGSNGFVTSHGEYVVEKDLQPLVSVRKNTMLTFAFMNYKPDWKDCRIKLKPFTSTDILRLVYTEQGTPDIERYASGYLTIKAQ